MTIKIVTDSTSDLPQNIIQELDITVVPLFINIGDEGYLDGVEITRKDFYTNLPSYEIHPTTGTPGIDAFSQTYTRLASEGATQILSIHISKSLSATLGVAEGSARQFDQIPVVVRDSLQLSAGTGFQVETAARMAQQGKTLDEIIEVLDDLAARTYVAAGLDTLEYLRRSGRMNAFMTGLGSLLQLKPILTMDKGLPGSVRVRTEPKAEARLVEILEEHSPIERFVLLHANAADKAEAFRSRIADLIPDGETSSMDITPVIGAHLGPGAIGYAIVSKKPKKNK
ncbi:MAG: DegV family protein [Anaerolineae bacterium]|nr:DegV family protein [Anaerolineae bacterium]